MSILGDVKSYLGIMDLDTSYDTDIIAYINSTISEIAVSSLDSITIDATTEWVDYYTDNKYTAVETLIKIKVKLIWDPPTTGYTTNSFQSIADKLEAQLQLIKEADVV